MRQLGAKALRSCQRFSGQVGFSAMGRHPRAECVDEGIGRILADVRAAHDFACLCGKGLGLGPLPSIGGQDSALRQGNGKGVPGLRLRS